MSWLDAVFPPRCAGCGALLPEAAPLCPDCRATLVDPPEPACAICAEPLDAPGRCGRCQAEPPPFAKVQVAFGFAGAMAEAIPRFKYQDRPFLAAPLADLALPRLRSALEGCDAVAPIPLHDARLRERGFDQALLLARELGRRAGKPVEEALLTRTRPTLHQVGSNRVERAENLRGAFAARPSTLKRVALVDDVVTTTATARDAARALRDAGVGEVVIVALARAL